MNPSTFLVVILLSASLYGFAAGVAPKCGDITIEVPVYDEEGDRLQYSVEAVVPTKYTKKEADEPGWLARNGFKPAIHGIRVTRLSPGEYTITLRSLEGTRVKRQITVFTSCMQRHSLVIERTASRGSIGDAAHDSVEGRLTGCSFHGDWWVRLAPVHGQAGRIYEGAVLSDGTFEVPAHLVAARYALLIGFQSSVIRTTMVNLRPSDGRSSAGQIDLKEVCPHPRIGTRPNAGPGERP